MGNSTPHSERAQSDPGERMALRGPSDARERPACVMAQKPAMNAAGATSVLPSGLGDDIDRDVARVRAATEPFKSTAAAEAAGYKRVTDCVEYQPAGAMGYHFQNNALLDTTLDVEHPEVLVYERMPDGTFKLNGVEFLVPISGVDLHRAAEGDGAAAQARRAPGHLVSPRLDVGAQPERPVRGLEPARQMRQPRQRCST